jgi:FkbM family methyltransferase
MFKPQTAVNFILKFLNLRLVRALEYEKLVQKLMVHANSDRINDLLATINPRLINSFDYPIVRSQLGQEVFVLATLGLKSNGYFVEFGATNGVLLSNTYVLEKYFGWTGICAEPARKWHKELERNRSCEIDFRCVYSSNGRILFKETNFAELSTISHFESGDLHSEYRQSGSYYEVETVTLKDLLSQHKAPQNIDYISIDTEGSELEILKNFDFSEYSVKIFSIEHNFTSKRFEIHDLLLSNGYKNVFPEISKFDDWYVLVE